MSPTDPRITCPLCGAPYSEAAGRACHRQCVLARACQLLSCPHCGYELPAPTRLTRWLARRLAKPVRAAE